jgi:hypothetical protein
MSFIASIVVFEGSMSYEDQLLKLSLPKWPQMLVAGEDVTRDQALEIIRRNDGFFEGHDGNDHDYIDWVRGKLLMGPKYSEKGEDWKVCFDYQDEWKNRWGLIRTEYVHNSRISTSYFLGTNGWMSPVGRIVSIGNVGKWPTVCTIRSDWEAIAKEFPFLDLKVLLLDEYHYEGDDRVAGGPIVGMIVKDGGVVLSSDFGKIRYEMGNKLLLDTGDDLKRADIEKWVDLAETLHRAEYDKVWGKK